jgi:hypothetical protein
MDHTLSSESALSSSDFTSQPTILIRIAKSIEITIRCQHSDNSVQKRDKR